MVLQTDVLICGAGPVGLSLAAQLQAMGVACQIIDRNQGRSEKSKALVIWGRSLELLHTCMDASAFVAVGRPVRKARFYREGNPFAEIEFMQDKTEFGTGVLIPQSSTEQLLEEHLVARGGRVKRSTELLSFVQGSDHVACVLRNAHGVRSTVHAKYLVGCDGAHSVVRQGLGFDFAGREDGLRWVLADVALTGNVPDVDVASMWSKSGILLLFHFGENVWRVVAEEPLSNPDLPRRDPTLQEIQRYLDDRGARGVRATNPVWLSEFRVSERKVADYALERVFVAGDAAHVHSPAGGQGMNTGIQDACNLAWKLAWDIRGVGGKRLLRSYSTERSDVAAMVVKTTSHITRLATTESRALQCLRNTVAKIALHFDWVQDKVRHNLAEYNVAYRKSEINGQDARSRRTAIRCGDRVPNVRWTDGLQCPRNLYAFLAGGRAALLILKSGKEKEIVAWEQGMPEIRQSWITVELLITGDSCEANDRNKGSGDNSEFEATYVSVGCINLSEFRKLGSVANAWMVVRPDGYLAAAGEIDDFGPATQWLSMLASFVD